MFLRKVEIFGLVVLALAVAATGAGWVTKRPVLPVAQASSGLAEPQKAEEKPKADAEKAERRAITGLEELGTALSMPVEFPGIDDPKTTLSEALGLLTKAFGVPLELNERAFSAEGVENIADLEIAHKPPPRKAQLRLVLAKLLSRLPGDATAAFLVRKDHIEITTENAAIRELGLMDSVMADLAGLGAAGGGMGGLGGGGVGLNVRLLPMICQNFRKVPLEKALDELADASGYNVLIDSRIEDKASAKVSARLINVPVDTAVRVLADMAGLSVVRIDNVFYVTSAENAERVASGKPLVRPGERPPAASAKPTPRVK